MAQVVGKQRVWSGSRDRDGHREYKIKWLVLSSVREGPVAALTASGLPRVGTPWNFDDDYDPWAFCKFDATLELHEHKEGDPHRYWGVTQTFSTKPDFRCNDTSVDNPLLEPMKVSGSFVKEKKEFTRDRNNKLLKSSSHEQFRGEKVEFEVNRPTVKIGQNVANLELGLFAGMMNTVNGSILWGLPARCIKLTTASWERKLYGQCFVYFTREFEFDVKYDTHDRFLLDEGTKVLHGQWSDDGGSWTVTPIEKRDATGKLLGSRTPDPNNPADFQKFHDRKGQETRVILDGTGKPALTEVWDESGPHAPTDPGVIKAEFADESNFLLLGIPTDLEA